MIFRRRACRLPNLPKSLRGVGLESEAPPAFSFFSAALAEVRTRHLAATFVEHVLRDEVDYKRHGNYLRYNPIKLRKAGGASLSRPTV
jgi:hypothetical protein